MKILRAFISRALMITAITFITCGHAVMAQTLELPDEWMKSMHNITPLYKADTLSICILGDVMMHSAQIEDAARKDGKYSFSTYFSLIQDRIDDADLTIANMEFTLGGPPYTGYPSFSAPDQFAEYLADSGIDVFLMANNHIFDKGSNGAARTLEQYDRLSLTHGVRYCGMAMDAEQRDINHPLQIRMKGMKISLINITYGTNTGGSEAWPKVNYMNDRALLLEALTKAEGSDFTLVLPHWGNEYETFHSSGQENTARWLIENGADAIVGAHPHVVQDAEYIEGVPVVYSLGNAVSNMSARNTQLGMIATIKIVRETDGDVRMLHPELTWTWCSRPGGFCSSYIVIPLEDYMDKPEEWKNLNDYKKMIETHKNINEILRSRTL